MRCANCKYNDGMVYTSIPPQYRCTITNEFHRGWDDCNVEFAPVVRCKDCKYFEEIMTARYRDGTTKEVQNCKKRVPLKDENFYCGWGERMESDVYCDRNLCTLNEYNGVGCDECQERRKDSDDR